MENNNNLPSVINSRHQLPQQVAGKGWKPSAKKDLAISEAVWEFYSSNQLELREDKTKTEEIGWQIHITAELQANNTLGTFHVTFENPAIRSKKDPKQNEKLRFEYTLEAGRYGNHIGPNHDYQQMQQKYSKSSFDNEEDICQKVADEIAKHFANNIIMKGSDNLTELTEISQKAKECAANLPARKDVKSAGEIQAEFNKLQQAKNKELEEKDAKERAESNKLSFQLPSPAIPKHLQSHWNKMKDQAEQKDTALNKKEKEILELRTEIDTKEKFILEKTAKIFELEQVITNENNKLEESKQNILNLEKRIKLLEEQLQEKDTFIKNSEEKNNNQAKELLTKGEKIKELESKVSTLEDKLKNQISSLQEKDDKILELKKTVAEKTNEFEQNRQTILELEGALEKEINDQNNNLLAKDEKIKELQSQINVLRSELETQVSSSQEKNEIIDEDTTKTNNTNQQSEGSQVQNKGVRKILEPNLYYQNYSFFYPNKNNDNSDSDNEANKKNNEKPSNKK